MALLSAAIGVALTGVATGQARSVEFESGGLRITITDLGLLPGGSTSSGLAINNHATIVGLANDETFAIQRPFWDATTGAIVGMAENMNPAGTAIPEHMNDSREMAGTEMYGDNVYQGVYWNAAGQAFELPSMAGVDPFYGGLHTKAHGINNLGQIVGTGKEAAPSFYTHAVLWPDKDTEAIDLGFLGQGTPMNYSAAYGVNDSSHVVGNSAVGTLTRGFLWRNGQMVDLGALSGQVVSEAYAINNTGLVAGKCNFHPVTWEYEVANPASVPTIHQLPIPAGFFDGVPTAVNDSGDVVGYAGAPSIYSHAIVWRNGVAIDLGLWPGGHYSVANGINDAGQIVGTGTVAGDNLDHALMWTIDDGASPAWSDLGHGLAGALGVPALQGSGALTTGSTAQLDVAGAAAGAPLWIVAGVSELGLPFLGGMLVPFPNFVLGGITTDESGAWHYAFPWPAGAVSGVGLFFQAWVQDAGAPFAYAATNALLGTTP